MPAHDRGRLRATFTEAAELYDRARPGYPPALFADLRRLARLTVDSQVLEIGCGTGQATTPLAELGCQIIAVELGAELADVARRNLARFPSVEVITADFEEWPLPDEPFDLVLAATAFHWIDPQLRVPKSASALHGGGTLATISTHHIAGGTEAFFVQVQDCYERFDPSTPPDLRLLTAADIPTDREEIERSSEFGPAEFSRYEWEQTYTAGEYLNLLQTYSGHRAMPAAARADLLDCIRQLANGPHAGRITKRYLTELRVARRIA